jgi:hypothetical protein
LPVAGCGYVNIFPVFPPALTFDKLSSGEQRVLKEMGVAEKVPANEKVGIIARPRKATSLKQGGK